jgi:uncharacterized membrane protein
MYTTTKNVSLTVFPNLNTSFFLLTKIMFVPSHNPNETIVIATGVIPIRATFKKCMYGEDYADGFVEMYFVRQSIERFISSEDIRKDAQLIALSI